MYKNFLNNEKYFEIVSVIKSEIEINKDFYKYFNIEYSRFHVSGFLTNDKNFKKVVGSCNMIVHCFPNNLPLN